MDYKGTKRQAIWRHNSYLGHARMMQMQANAIIASPTTTVESKRLATEIFTLAELLSNSLRSRNDQ